MFSKRDLNKFLEESSSNVKLMKFDFVSAELFFIEMKCEVERDQPAEFYDRFSKEWIKKFSNFTATTWIVRSVFSKMKRLVFRKIYACHRSSFNKKKKMGIESRNQECKAKIDFRVKFINRNTIKNDPLLKEGLNITISIEFKHTHKVRTPLAYSLLRNSSEIDEVFLKYFKTGCSTTAAKTYHELTLTERYGENCPEVFENARINPTIRHITYIHGKKRTNPKRIPEYKDLMEEKQTNLKLEGTELEFLSDKKVVVIITPLMKSVVSNLGAECVVIDSTETQHFGLIVTYFLVPTRIGALPIACVIHESDINKSFHHAFALAKKTLEGISKDIFAPKIILLSHYEKQCQSIDIDCKKYQSRYTLCVELWVNLCNDECYIDKKKRHAIMLAIKSLIYAENCEAAEKIYSELLENEIIQSDPKFKEKLTNLWKIKDRWMLLGGSNVNNHLTDMSVRFLKGLFALQCRSFTIGLLVEVVANVLDKHYRKIIMSYVMKRKSVMTYTKFFPKAKIVLGFGSEVRRISANEFKVERQHKPKKFLHFRTDTMFCDCQQGTKGAFCEHLAAIVNTVDCEIMKPPILTEEERDTFRKIAGEDIEDETKPEVSEDAKDLEAFDVYEKQSLYGDEIMSDNGQLDTASVASSTKMEGQDYFCLENIDIKTEKPDRLDPLEDESDTEQGDLIIPENVAYDPAEETNSNAEMKTKYETVLRAVNAEFRRLNRLFCENPNVTNLETMKQIARELSKIKPLQKLDLGNLHLKLNKKRKRKKNSY